MSAFSAITEWLQRRWAALRELVAKTRGVPFIVLAVTAPGLVLIGLPQGRDLVLTIAEDPSWERQPVFLLGALFLGHQAWMWSRWVIVHNYLDDRLGWRASLPRLLGVLPIALGSAAVLTALYKSGALREEGRTAAGWGMLLLATLYLGFAPARWRPQFVKDAGAALARVAEAWGPLKLGWRRAFALAALFFLIPMGMMLALPATLPLALGAPAVVFLAAGLMIPVMTLISQAGVTTRLPLMLSLVLLLALSSVWLGREHLVGRRAGQTCQCFPLATKRPLEEAFAAWRAQAPRYSDGSIPIVFVVSAGGASRAGYWTGEVLAALEEETHGRFSKSVFAISAVSGGAVGAVGYVATLKDGPAARDGGFRQAVEDFAGGDFLSAALAGMLFPDLVQRFIPWPMLPDRAEALEKAFEHSWRRACRKRECKEDDLLAQRFLKLWEGGGPWRPIILVNGAGVDSGRRIITSPVVFTGAIDADDFHDLAGADVRISTAITNGARFPIVSPPGLIRDWRGPEFQQHIVDGGYFDATGMETARELSHALLANHSELKPIFLYVHFVGDGEPAEAVVAPTDASAVAPAPSGSRESFRRTTWLQRYRNQFVAPLIALFRNRTGYQRHFRDDVHRPERLVSAALCDVPGRIEVPMNWALSERAKRHAQSATGLDEPGMRDPCPSGAALRAFAGEISALHDPSATARAGEKAPSPLLHAAAER